MRRAVLTWTMGGVLSLVVLGAAVGIGPVGTGHGAVVSVPPTYAQQAPSPPLSAGLMRRLAEAADGYRTGAPVWVVASLAAPYEVAGVFAEREAAIRVARDSGAGRWGYFGPFVTPVDLGHQPVLIVTPPEHCRPTIMCWKALPAPPDTAWLTQDVDSIGLTIFHRSGRSWHGNLDPEEVDAVFFTLSALDKFVIPYYSAISGPEYAARLRASIVSRIHFAP